jgi:hypothetical protein
MNWHRFVRMVIVRAREKVWLTTLASAVAVIPIMPARRTGQQQDPTACMEAA